ncbi:MAG: archease [Thermoplasmata archaeon]|nr:archease [Thermoplasmata archaeon]
MSTRNSRPRNPERRWGSFPTTADVGVWARAREPEQLFEALGLGLVALSVDLRGVRALEERRFRVSGSDLSRLVVAYLGALLSLEQEEGFFPREIAVRLTGRPPTSVAATARGEMFDRARHRGKKEVKAITFHRLQIDLVQGTARVIVDI